MIKALTGLSAARALRYLTMPVTAKVNALFLGTAGVGVMSQVNAVGTAAAVLSTNTVSDGAARLLSRSLAGQSGVATIDPRRVLGTFTAYVLLVNAVFLGAVLVGARAIAGGLLGDRALAGILVLFAFSLPLAAMDEVVNATLRGASCFGAMSTSMAVGSVVALVVSVPLVVRFGLFGAVLALALTRLLSLVIRVLLAWRALSLRGIRPLCWPTIDRAVARELRGYIGTTMVMGLAAAGLSLATRLVMVGRVGINGVGVYAVVLVFAGLVPELVGIPIATVLLPQLSVLQDGEARNALVNRVLRMACASAVLLVGAMLSLRHLGIRLVYTSDFDGAGIVMGPHLIGVAINALAGTIGVLYYSLPRLRALVTVEISCQAVLLGLTWLLARPFGLWGISFAYLAMYGIGFTANCAFLSRVAGLRIGATLLRVALPAIAFLAVLSWLPMCGWVEPVLGLSSAAGLSWLWLPAAERDAVLARPRRVLCALSGRRAGL